MNTCSTCNTNQRLKVKLPQFVPDEKLAFVERVCGLLIESRFSNGRAEIWDDGMEELCSAFGIDIIDKPRFARPTALATISSLPATRDSRKGTRGLPLENIRGSPRSPFTFSC